MIKYTTVKVDKQVWDDVLCNKCGESLKQPANSESYDYAGLVEAEFSCGYFTVMFSDMDVYKFSLCESCLSQLFTTFKIDPLVTDEE